MSRSMHSLTTTYSMQKSKAELSGIGWELSFEQWMALWTESGHLEERGNEGHEYCLSRINKKLPFKIGNCVIDTNSTSAKNKTEEELSASSKNGKLMQLLRKEEGWYGYVQTPDGRFLSARDAATFYGTHWEAIEKRIRSSNFPEYYREFTDGTVQEVSLKRKYTRDTSKDRIRACRTPLGEFPNAKMAAKAHEMSETSMHRRLISEAHEAFQRV